MYRNGLAGCVGFGHQTDKVEQKPFDLDERPFVYQQPVEVPLEPYLLHRSQGRKGIAFGVLGKERHGGSVSLSNELEAVPGKEYLQQRKMSIVLPVTVLNNLGVDKKHVAFSNSGLGTFNLVNRTAALHVDQFGVVVGVERQKGPQGRRLPFEDVVLRTLSPGFVLPIKLHLGVCRIWR